MSLRVGLLLVGLAVGIAATLLFRGLGVPFLAIPLVFVFRRRQPPSDPPV